METVIEILTELRDDQEDDLKSYDRSVMWNSWGYVYLLMRNMKAIELMNVIIEPEVTLPHQKLRSFYLAQLNLVKKTMTKVLN